MTTMNWKSKRISHPIIRHMSYVFIHAVCITSQVTAMDAIAKKATLDSGAVIVAPDFINEGDVIKVNTEDGTYAGRSS